MIESFDPLPLWIARACLATLFAHAALAKWGDAALFEQHLAAYRVRAGLAPLLRVALPTAEALAAVLLLTPWRAGGAVLAAALLLTYGAAMAWHLAHDRVLDCGCGGEPLPVSWALVARNAALVGMAALAAAPATARAMGMADFMVVAASVLLATLLYAALHQVLRHVARPAAAGWRRS
ncbi:MAG: MauE/DoxX family redox-associated membrane protein [Burkholderiaceae bacterium]